MRNSYIQRVLEAGSVTVRNVKEFVKLTLWTLSLMKQCRPGVWTLEQIPVIARYVMLETPYAEVLNMREFTAQTSDRKRLIASKRDLKLQKLSAAEYKEKFISPNGRAHHHGIHSEGRQGCTATCIPRLIFSNFTRPQNSAVRLEHLCDRTHL